MTMRILLDATCVNDDALTGAARYVIALVRALRVERGIDLHVFTFSRRAFAEFPDHVRVSRLDLPRVLGPVAREASRRRFVSRAAHSGVDLVHYTLDPAPPIDGVRSVLTLFDMARRAPSFRAATGASLRALMRTHLRYGLAKRMDLLIATTPHAAREIASDLPYPAAKIRVSPIATDPAFTPGVPDASALSRHGLVAGEYVLFVGQLGRQKNEDGLLAAFRSAKERNLVPATMRLALAGDDSQAAAGTRAAIRNAASVSMLGTVSDDDLVHLYRGAVCLALPSFVEGYGLPVQEAMACGTPALVSRGTCLVDVAGAGGIAVDPNNLDGMRDTIANLVNDRNLYERLSRGGIEQSSSRTDAEMARAHLEAYRDALR